MSDNLYLFANNNGGQAENNGSYRLYNMKIEGEPEGVVNGVNYVEYFEYNNERMVFDTRIPYGTDVLIEFKLNKYHEVDNNLNTIIFTKNSGVGYRDNGEYIQGNLIVDDNGVKHELQSNNNVYQYTFKRKNDFFLPYFCIGTCRTGNTSACRIEYVKFYKNDQLIGYFRPCIDTQGVACLYNDVTKQYFYQETTSDLLKCKNTLRVFQPVLDSNNIPCLLDKINNKFYYNKGTGSFTYGGIQTPKDGYTEVEYIESTGTQYIDTEVVPNSNTDIDMTCRACDYSESPTVNNSYILNGLVINDNKYNYKGTDTTVQPNLVASEGATLTMGSTNLAYLTDDEKEQAINNGWSLL